MASSDHPIERARGKTLNAHDQSFDPLPVIDMADHKGCRFSWQRCVGGNHSSKCNVISYRACILGPESFEQRAAISLK